MTSQQCNCLVLVLLQCLCGCLVADGSGLEAFGLAVREVVLTPNDPVAEIGGRLALQCSILPSYRGTLNSSYIYFRHNNRNYSSRGASTDGPTMTVTVVNRTTSVLLVQNVTSDSFGHYVCTLPDLRTINSDSQNVHVLKRPRVPSISGCVIHNWQQLECRWTPSVGEQKNYTGASKSQTQSFEWAYLDEDGLLVWRNCSDFAGTQDSTSTRCSIFGEGRAIVTGSFFYDRICVRSSAMNALLIPVISDLWCANVNSIVTISQPEGLQCSTNDSRVIMSWRPPRTVYRGVTVDELEYRVTVRSQWTSNVTSFELHGVTFHSFNSTPFTRYNITVSVKPSSSGLWSDAAQCVLTSPSAAPSVSPSTMSTAFHVSIGTSPKLFTFYWKAMLPQLHYGPGFRYCLLKRSGVLSSDRHWSPLISTEADKSFVELPVADEEIELQYGVASCSDEGQKLPEVFWQYSQRLSKSIKRFSVEGDNMKVIVHWEMASEFSNIVDGLTLFWCLNHAGHCKNDIDWMDLSMKGRSAELLLNRHYSSYLFGISSSSVGTSGGIHWIDCVHELNSIPRSPQKVHASLPSYAQNGELLVTWLQGVCSTNEGLASLYSIHYCQLNERSMCSGEPLSVNVTSDANSWNLTNLSHGASYSVWMTSVSSVGRESMPSSNSTASTTASWATNGVIAVIVIFLLIFVLFLGCILWRICRCLIQCQRQYTHGLAISPPQIATKIPLENGDEDDDIANDYVHPSDLRDNCNSNHLTKPLIAKEAVAPVAVTNTPSPTVCGCGQGDILWYVNSPLPVVADGEVISAGYHPQTYQLKSNTTLNDSGLPLLSDAETSFLVEDKVPSVENSPPSQQTAVGIVSGSSTCGSSNLPASSVSDSGYIVVGPESFDWMTSPNQSINSSTEKSGLGRTGDFKSVNSDLEPSNPVSPETYSTLQQSVEPPSSNSAVSMCEVPPTNTSSPCAVPDPSEVVVPLAQYAKIVGALERSSPVNDHTCEAAESFSTRPPAVERNNGLTTTGGGGGRCDNNISFGGTGTVLFHNGYVRHADIFMPAAAVVDS